MGSPPERLFAGTVTGRKGEILDAALRVFRNEGYAGGSMRRIAEEVGISEPALYRHFEGKEELFLTLIEQYGRLIRDAIAPVLREARPEDPSTTIRTLLEGRDTGSHGGCLALMVPIMVAAAHSPVFLDAYRVHVVEPLADELAALVPRFDAHFAPSPAPRGVAERIFALMSLFVGYFAMSSVSEEAAGDITDAVMRIMGWSGS